MSPVGAFGKRMIQLGAKSGVCRPMAANTYRSLSSNSSSGNKAVDDELPPWAPSNSNSSGHNSGDDTRKSEDPDLGFPAFALIFIVCCFTTAGVQSLDRGSKIKKLQQQMNDTSKKVAEIDETIPKLYSRLGLN